MTAARHCGRYQLPVDDTGAPLGDDAEADEQAAEGCPAAPTGPARTPRFQASPAKPEVAGDPLQVARTGVR